MYSIKAISTLTGLGAETLRAWERRYSTVLPRRDDGGRRYYSQEDLEKLMLLANLSRQGHAIGKLSDLSYFELQQLQNNNDTKQSQSPDFVEQIVANLADYQLNQCEMLLKRGLIAKEPLAYLRDVLIPALQKVGDLWHAKKITIAQEHMFSACVKRILLGMVNNLQSFSGQRPSMMFGTPVNEPHEFGILMSCLLAAEQDYHCYYLGSNVPAADMLAAAAKLNVDIIVLGLTQNPPDSATSKDLHNLFPKLAAANIDIWLGGNAAMAVLQDVDDLPSNIRIIQDIDDFYLKAKHWRLDQMGKGRG